MFPQIHLLNSVFNLEATLNFSFVSHSFILNFSHTVTLFYQALESGWFWESWIKILSLRLKSFWVHTYQTWLFLLILQFHSKGVRSLACSLLVWYTVTGLLVIHFSTWQQNTQHEPADESCKNKKYSYGHFGAEWSIAKGWKILEFWILVVGSIHSCITLNRWSESHHVSYGVVWMDPNTGHQHRPWWSF